MRTGREGTAALDKALDVLEIIGSSPTGLTQTELSEKVDLPKTTLYRLIATLIDRGMLRRDPLRKVYRLGFRYLELVRNAYLEPDLVAAASMELRALRDLTGETSYLAVLEGTEVMSLERCDGAHSERSAAALGQSKPLYCTGQGKAILSALDDRSRSEIIKGLTLAPLTPHTLTDRRRLQTELRIIKSRGYAIDDEEIVLGIRCVAAPIIDNAGVVRGALSVAGPAYRLTRPRLDLLGPELVDAARRVGAQLTVTPEFAGDGSVSSVEAPWAFHGAFPRWSEERRHLYWADTLAPAVRRYDGTSDRVLARLDAPIVALEWTGHELLAATSQGWYRVEEDRIEPLIDWPAAGIHSTCFDKAFGLWLCRAASRSGFEVGRLYPSGEFEPRWHFTEPMAGLAWDASRAVLYGVAPASGTVFRMQLDSANVRRFASQPKGSGILSGLACDAHGGVWTVMKDGWSIVRFDQDGTLDRVIGLPVPCPTDVVTTDEHGFQLYVTSSRHEVSMEALGNAPLAGSLFRVSLSADDVH